MLRTNMPSDALHWYLSELTSRIVAVSGIPNDRFHVGKLILNGLKEAPDFPLQIDAGTDEMETCGSVLKRTVRMATCFKNMGLKLGDVITIMAPNHIDVCVPYYAGLYLGIIVSPIDRTWTDEELKAYFELAHPKLVFCQSERATDVQKALNATESDTLVVSFDKGDYLFTYQQFINKYSDNSHVDDFKAANFDPAETGAFLMPTSGTTGTSKLALSTHKNIMLAAQYTWSMYPTFPTPTERALIVSPLQWLTALVTFVMCPILKMTRIQTSKDLSKEHCCEIFNKYKPTWTIFSPTFVTSLLNDLQGQCDLTSLELLFLGGSAVTSDILRHIKEVTPNTLVLNGFGMTELTGLGFYPIENGALRQLANLWYRLVDVESGKDITKSNEPGELWLKGPGIFKEYYNNPEATSETYAEGDWFKTGDLFYKDEHDNYYYVDRIKMMLKYKSYQVSPVKLEALIRSHPGVLDVVVTGLSDPECGDIPVALVVKNYEQEVTAQDIKDMVKETLSDPNQLRGGVAFIETIPVTATSKVNRRKAKEMVKDMVLE